MAFSLRLDSNTFSALRSRNFKMFLAGQFVAVSGIWIQRIATSWLVYSLTKSPFKLGLVELVMNTPILIAGLIAGAWLEKHDVRKTMITTQSLTMIYAVIMALLVYTDVIEYYHILLLSLFLGIITAFDMPARQSSILLMVADRKDLKSALALQSMVFNIARFIGPSIGGLLVYNFGEALCFTITALCYLPVIYVLSTIRLKDRENFAHNKKNIIYDVIEGMQYVKNFFPLFALFAFLGSFGLFSYSYNVFFPIYAKDILNGSSRFFGIIMGLFGCGAIMGAFSVASIMQLKTMPRDIGWTAMLYASCMAVFALSTSPVLSLIVVIPAGFGLIATFIATSTLIQTIAANHMRSRVISLYTICNLGFGPIGCFLAGISIKYLSPQTTLLMWCSAMIFVSFMLLRQVKKINKNLESVWQKLDTQ